MSEREPRRGDGRRDTPDTQKDGAESETVADLARRMAERIGRLGDEVVSSFELSDASQRVARLRQVQNEITLGMFPVISWLERRRSTGAAELVTRRMYHVLSEAVACAGHDIPQYAGGMKARITGEPAPGAQRTAAMVVSAKVIAASLLEWATDIDAEGENHSPPSSGKGKAKAGAAKKASPPKVPPHYRSAVRLWPIFQEKMQKVGKRTTIDRFRVWLQERRKPILLDDEFDNWWNNIYGRQLRRRST